jgi:hypothetical protein
MLAGMSIAQLVLIVIVVAAQVAGLVEGGLHTMFLTKAKIAMALFFVVILFAAGAGVPTHQALAGPG